MRFGVVLAVSGSLLMAGCASTTTASMVAPKSVSAKQDAAYRAQCEAAGDKATKADTKFMTETQEKWDRAAVGGGIGGGFIGAIVAVAMTEALKDNEIKSAVSERASQCLAKRGYRPT